MQNTQTATCSIDGCTNPRHISQPSGKVHSRCTTHLREDYKRYDEKRGKRKVLTEHGTVQIHKVCMRDGCNEPRHTSKNGMEYQYCAEHQKMVTREAGRKKREKKSAQQLPAAAQVEPDFNGRNAAKAASKLANQQIVKLLLIDYDSDEEVYIEGKVTLRCPTHRDSLPPGGYALLLERHADLDYIVAERGTPPPAPGAASRYDWSD